MRWTEGRVEQRERTELIEFGRGTDGSCPVEPIASCTPCAHLMLAQSLRAAEPEICKRKMVSFISALYQVRAKEQKEKARKPPGNNSHNPNLTKIEAVIMVVCR